jgi:hypothetical protein
MPPTWESEDDWEKEEEFTSDDDQEPTIPCPYCNREILEILEQCPHCGNYLSEEDAPPSRKPWWILLGAMLALYALYWWIYHS